MITTPSYRLSLAKIMSAYDSGLRGSYNLRRNTREALPQGASLLVDELQPKLNLALVNRRMRQKRETGLVGG
jgi:hypothetical protein